MTKITLSPTLASQEGTHEIIIESMDKNVKNGAVLKSDTITVTVTAGAAVAPRFSKTGSHSINIDESFDISQEITEGTHKPATCSITMS